MSQIMNAKEMEQWLLKKGAVQVTKKAKKEPWYREVSKLPPCLNQGKVAEDQSDYMTKNSNKTSQANQNNETN